jgi:hypothetical protein
VGLADFAIDAVEPRARLDGQIRIVEKQSSRTRIAI